MMPSQEEEMFRIESSLVSSLHDTVAPGSSRTAVGVPPVDRPAAHSQDQEGGKQILVLYRYTHFSAVPGGVEVCRSTKLHELRFTVLPVGDAAGSLTWDGALLAPLIYPAHHTNALQALWSRLVSQVSVPPEATRVHVMADVGILRREDYARRRMERVRAALASMMAEPWPGYHVAMELRLPESVHMQCADEAEAVDGEDVDYCERPTKRRKIVTEEGAGQECPVCFEPLESDAAAWPECSLPHIFHGACLEETLKESEKCPICRRRLSALDEQV
uniref:RING-type domain-containing protein n=1 Tax=Aegilops tauschii TaxID=37682 RepID=R7WBA1_AEGTA